MERSLISINCGHNCFAHLENRSFVTRDWEIEWQTQFVTHVWVPLIENAKNHSFIEENSPKKWLISALKIRCSPLEKTHKKANCINSSAASRKYRQKENEIKTATKRKQTNQQ